MKAELAAQKKQLRGADDQRKTEIYETMALLEARIIEIKDSKTTSRESIRRPLPSYEVFTQVTVFTQKMLLKQASALELGLFLATLREFAREPWLGGKRHLGGLGEVSGQWSVTVWHPDQDTPEKIGDVSFDQTGFVIEGTPLKTALAKWDGVKDHLEENGIDFTRYLERESA